MGLAADRVKPMHELSELHRVFAASRVIVPLSRSAPRGR